MFAEAPEGGAQVWGTCGYGRTFPSELRLELGGIRGTFTPEFPARMEQCDWPMYQHQIEHWAECIRNGGTLKPSGEDGVVLMRVMDALYRSAATGDAVAIG